MARNARRDWSANRVRRRTSEPENVEVIWGCREGVCRQPFFILIILSGGSFGEANEVEGSFDCTRHLHGSFRSG